MPGHTVDWNRVNEDSTYPTLALDEMGRLFRSSHVLQRKVELHP